MLFEIHPTIRSRAFADFPCLSPLFPLLQAEKWSVFGEIRTKEQILCFPGDCFCESDYGQLPSRHCRILTVIDSTGKMCLS